MNRLETPTLADSTSAAGAMLIRQVREPVLVGCMLVGLGTASTAMLPPDVALRLQHPVVQTTAGAMATAAAPAGAALGELRRLSGLTWEQLARLFDVSRRALHFWASGKRMTPGNEEHLQRLLAVVKKIDRGSAVDNRALLLGVREDGCLPFDLLAAGHYDRVVALLGSSEGRKASTTQLSLEARAARTPRPPEELVDALQDRIHPTSGRLLTAKPIAISRRK